jgi:hypothetical protein
MKQETFESYKNDELYKFSAVPFIERLISLNVPLSAIDTNDWHCNTAPRVYVTREYGRENGGATRKAHVSQFGYKSANRLAKFYHSEMGIQ